MVFFHEINAVFLLLLFFTEAWLVYTLQKLPENSMVGYPQDIASCSEGAAEHSVVAVQH